MSSREADKLAQITDEIIGAFGQQLRLNMRVLRVLQAAKNGEIETDQLIEIADIMADQLDKHLQLVKVAKGFTDGD